MDKGFRVIKFKIINFLNVNDVEIDFYNKDIIDGDFGCTLVIGENGSGKTELTIKLIDAFLDLDNYKVKNKKRKSDRSFNYELIYFLDGYTYEVICENSSYKFKKNNVLTTLEEICLPNKLIAQSFTFADKFNFKTDGKYAYLGTRSASNVSYVSHFQNTIAEILSKNILDDEFNFFLNNLLKFLNFDKKIGIQFIVRSHAKLDLIEKSYKEFSKMYKNFELRRTKSKINVYIENSNLREIHSKIVRFIKSDEYKKDDLISYQCILNEKIDNNELFEFYTVMRYLSYLNILSSPNVKFSKYDQDMVMNLISSGEKQIIYSFLTIYTTITSNSLVIIDEPEISLHPNWQMKYLKLLENLFAKYVDSHFIIATHSHFMISDIKKGSSSVIVMNRNEKKISAYKYDLSTYGWSAEDILYNVFRVPSNRNYYIAKDVEEIAKAISLNSFDENVKNKISFLKEILPDINENDPLKVIIYKIMQTVKGKIYDI